MTLSKKFSPADVLVAFCGILPVLYLARFGRPYREPKLLALWIVAAVCAFLLIRKKTPALVLHPAHGLLAVWCVFQGFSFFYAPNAGLVLQAVLSTGAALCLSLFFFRYPVDGPTLRRALLPATGLVVLAMVLRIFTAMALAMEGQGLGAFVGERNSAAALLAFLWPLFLVPLVAKRAQRAVVAQYWSLGAVVVFCILAARTRAAWWMLIGYGVVFALAAFGKRSERRAVGRRAGIALASQIGVAVLLLATVPTTLVWTSSTPYWDSFRTLTSPEEGNGRRELWQVGGTIARAHPWKGVGAGNYAVVVRDYISAAEVDPTVLKFLHNDLPLFQDYLQAFVETGILGGLLFFLLAAVLPLLVAWRRWRETDFSFEKFAPALACLALAGNGLLDYPLQRPECLALFTVFLSFAAYGLPSNSLTVRAARPALASFAVIALLAAGAFGTSLALRRFAHARDMSALFSPAFRLWPWDANWDERTVVALLRRGDRVLAAEYVNARRKSWPSDPATAKSVHLLSVEARTAVERTPGETCGSAKRAPAMDQIPVGTCSTPTPEPR